ncbi:MAG: phage portal protein [Pseudomonadota bacterium]
MTVFGRLKKLLFMNISLTDPKAWDRSLWNLIGSQSLSGENVTEETALTYSAVFNAVTLISGTVSTLPLHLLRKDKRKTLHVIEKRLYRVLHDRFNSLMTAQVGREVMAAHILTWGNCYAEKVFNGSGDIVELWPIAPNRVILELQEGALVYRVRVGNEEKILPREKILHIPGLGFDGLVGYSVISMARKSIGLGMAMETFGSLYFGKGTHPSAVITHPNQIKDIKAFRESVSEVYAGLGNSNQLMVLEDGMKIDKVGIPPEDAQFLQSRQHQIPEIARWFNLPPHKLKDLTRSSFSNIESEQISYVTDSILPWLIRFEQHYNMQLLTDSEQFKQNIYIRHNVDGLLRGNSASRATYYKAMFGTGAMTINEIREKESWDPDPNPYADELFVPVNNMIPLSKIDEYLAKQGQAKMEVKPPEQAPKKGNGEDKDGLIEAVTGGNHE